MSKDACELCGTITIVMIGMEPGHDRKEWFLCSKCWTEERQQAKLEKVAKPSKSKSK